MANVTLSRNKMHHKAKLCVSYIKARLPRLGFLRRADAGALGGMEEPKTPTVRV